MALCYFDMLEASPSADTRGHAQGSRFRMSNEGMSPEYYGGGGGEHLGIWKSGIEGL